MPFVESVGEFVIRHGGNALKTSDGKGRRILLFPNGARITFGLLGDVDMQEPPPNGSRAGLEVVRRYHAHKLSGLEHAFNRLKLALHGRAAFKWNERKLGPPPRQTNRYGEPDGKAALKRIKELAGPHRKAIAEIDTKIEALPEMVARREAAERFAAEVAARRLRDEEDAREVLGVQWPDEEQLVPQGD